MIAERPGRWRRGVGPVVRVVVLGAVVAGLLIGAPAVRGVVDTTELVLGTPESVLQRAGLETGAGDAAGDPAVRRVALACPGPDRRAVTDPAATASPPGSDQVVQVLAATAPTDLLALGDTAATDDTETGEGGVRLEVTGADAADGVSKAEGRPAEAVGTEAASDGPVLVTGEGVAAPGLVATQAETVRPRQGRGLTLTPCIPGSTDQWLLAGGSGPGRAESLVLVNPGSGPVTATVEVLGAEGRVDVGAGAQVVVAPGERSVLVLDALAPGVQAPAVRVRTEGGDLSAFLADRWLDGARDHGQELVAPAAPPGTDLVLAGIPGSGDVALRLAVPGEVAAVVEVTALTEDGPQTLDTRALAAPAAATTQVDLTDLPTGAGALRVTSDQPVVAAAQVTRAPEEVDDGVPGLAGELAWVPATAPVQGLAGTALPPVTDDLVRSELLVLSTTHEDGARVEVEQVPEGSTGEASSVVQVAPGASTLVPVDGAGQIWVRPQGGRPVHAALSVEVAGPAGAMSSVLPLGRAVTERTVTAVVPDEDAASRP